jgi:ribose-phosphate pyrophosphokinase
MKFGADLKNSIVPEWQHGYIAYDELKRLIKELSSLEGCAKESAEEDFFMMLEDELEKVNRFYLEKIQEFDGELKVLEGRPRSDSNSALAAGGVPSDRMVALHAQIGQLQAFVWLNTQGFEKIMKKYDKFMGLRHTPGAKSPDFEARLRGEVFKSERLDACLEKFKATRSQLSSDVGALEMKLISGSANKPLAEEISARLGVPLSPAKVRRFNDGEVNIQLCDSVRGCNVYIVQPTCPPVNDHLVELLLLISAARRASAASVTAVVPYYGYARQDRKDRSRVPISAADVARMMEAMGVDRVVCVDLHCAQIQGFFGPRTPVDNLFAAPIAVTYFNMKDLVKPVIVSPDAGGVARAKLFMEGFSRLPDPPEVSLAVILKQRVEAGVVGTMHLVGSVEGCDCIIVDDMIDTAGTLTAAANELRNFGAKRVFAFATHGLFSGPAADRAGQE